MKTGLDKETYRELFGKILVFRSLSAEAKAFLLEKGEILSFEGGERIVIEGDISPSFFAVLEGSVFVSLKQESSDVYIDTLGPGQLFGEAAMFINVERTADVTTSDHCVVIKLTRFDMMEFLRQNPREGNKFLLATAYGLLHKLKSSNHELAFERRGDSQQADVDALVAELTG